MARKVFFSFYYDRDIRRVVQVRNSWRFRNGDSQPFIDKAEWEKLERTGPAAVKGWIDRNMDGAGVTVVLIGAQTYTRPYVRYEIEQSRKLHKGLLGIRISRIRDPQTGTDVEGLNPFDYVTFEERNPAAGLLGFTSNTRTRKYSDVYPVYDWVLQDGQSNMEAWIEAAAKAAGR